MTIIGLIIALAVLYVFTRLSLRFWDRHEIDGNDYNRHLFHVWFFKGVIVPLGIWMLVNAGISERFPPVLASIEAAKSKGGNWVSAWLGIIPFTLFVLSSYWMGATFVWLVAAHAVEMECDRRDLVASLCVWGLFLSPILALILYLTHLAGLGVVIAIWLIPVLAELLALGNPRKKVLHPVYSAALKRINKGEYKKAEREVIRQLSSLDSDFEGWMMLAELYANHFNDLPEADRLVRELCRQPNLTRDQMCDALHRLADWHLKVGRDVVAARNALEEICKAFPATHSGDVARQRISAL